MAHRRTHALARSSRPASRLLTSALAAIAVFSAALPAVSVRAEVAQTPLPVSQVVRPQVLLAMSNDHQLYYKAYTDWSDIDDDGVADPGYKHTFNYYGYFDPFKCYSYSTNNQRYEPTEITTTKYCDGNHWSGNFLNWVAMTRMDVVRKVFYGGKRSTDTASETVLERSFIPTEAHSFAKTYTGADIAQLTPFSGQSAISFCNTTYASASGTAGQSQNVTEPPLIRVASGAWPFWAANERWQCVWKEERGRSNYSTIPGKSADGLGQNNYVARIQACVSNLLGTEECRRYPSGNYKPTGLLHEYGENGELQFGLMTGSYQKNKSGGVLRKNISSFRDEVNVTTDGTFTNAAGIVDALDRMRLSRYYYGTGNGDGDGLYNNTDSCPWGQTSFAEGKCSNWGNPISEILGEAVRYYAGKSATTAFAADDSSYINGLTTAGWTDPLDSDNWCAKNNIILVNASEISYDADVDISDLPGSPDVTALTDAIGVAEGIEGNEYFVGENGVTNNQLCTAKRVDSLGSVRGTCPGSPRLGGTYLLTGVAHYANTTDLRPTLEGDQTVATRGITLAPGVPKIVIPVPGDETRQVTILPACRNTNPNPDGNCGLVDFKILSQDIAAGTGRFHVNWEDTEQGADYDQDMRGDLNYVISGTEITITTDTVAQSTPYKMGFGYILSGTTEDGFHVHSGINGFSHTDHTQVLSCSNCKVGDDATSVTYTLGESDAQLLNDPLWYASKYGAFTDLDDDDVPDNDNPGFGNSEWDADADGDPDGYFNVTNPANLGESIASVFETVSQLSSSAAVAANSASLSTGTVIYQARYDSADWSGNLVALPIYQDGSIGNPTWEARDMLATQDWASGRTILTSTDTKESGVSFTWGNLSDLQQDNLRTDPISGNYDQESEGQARLRYLRGDIREELGNGGTMRARDYMLGDIVNSEPTYVKEPLAGYAADLESASYQTFADDYADRDAMVYVAANDGMLHGFDAVDGSEKLAYIPRAAYAKLGQLTRSDYASNHQYINDGSPTIADAFFDLDDEWHTVLASGMGAGGKGVYALDVTNPDAFSESNAYSTVLWDVTVADTGFSDLGYTYARPAIFKYPDDAGGDWVAAFGNGYESAMGKAVLYIVDAEDGDLLETLTADAGPNNGLSTPAPVDVDGDHRVDYIYAGDLLGNLWRFEPDGAFGWRVSFNGQPLFTATGPNGEVQSITAPPEVRKHELGGAQVYFGTGRYFETGDNVPDTSVVQTYYGVWDRMDGTSSMDRTQLLEQEILDETTVSGTEVRVTSNYAITWDETAAADEQADVGGGNEEEAEEIAPSCQSVTVDGDVSDWDLAGGALAKPMREAGNFRTRSNGNYRKDLLSNAFLTFDQDSQRLSVLVLAEEGLSVDVSADEAWVKAYSLDQTKLADGNSDDFSWVYDADGTAVGYEVSFDLADGSYDQVEIHVNVDGGRTSSTGKRNVGGRDFTFTLDTTVLPPSTVCEETGGTDEGTGDPGDETGGTDETDTTIGDGEDGETHMGWFIDLINPVGPTAEGEIQVSESQLHGDRIIFVTTIPSDEACDFGGTGWIMELVAEHGGPPEYALFDLDGNGSYGSEDLISVTDPGEDGQTGTDDDVEEDITPTGVKSEVNIIQKPAIIGAGLKEYKYASGSDEAQIQRISENPGGAAGGRASWIQIF